MVKLIWHELFCKVKVNEEILQQSWKSAGDKDQSTYVNFILDSQNLICDYH